jgi:uncharacterized cofD-like protein
MNGLRRVRYWLTPGMGVKRHVIAALAAGGVALSGAAAIGAALAGGAASLLPGGVAAVVAGGTWVALAMRSLNRSLLSHWLDDPRDAAALLHRRLLRSRGPRVVALGGGTGLSRLLRGLRPHSANVTAVVAVSDDGGSSGRLRVGFGTPAPGDLSDCLAALSADEALLGRSLPHRFTRGGELAGHTLGNLLITGLSDAEGDFAQALRSLQKLLALDGAVWPATPASVTLRVTKADGRMVDGESASARSPGAAARVALIPSQVEAMPEVIAALQRADLVLLGPGSLFTSTLPPLLVPAVGAALRASRARLVQVVNIMTEAGETDGFDAWDHVAAVREHLGRLPDLVVVNDAEVDAARREAYAGEGAMVVAFDPEPFRAAGVAWVAWPLLSAPPVAQHDAETLCERLMGWWSSYAA